MQGLVTRSEKNFKAVIRASLERDHEVVIEDAALAENTSGPGISRLKGKTIRSRLFPEKCQAVGALRKLFSLNEEVEMSLGR